MIENWKIYKLGEVSKKVLTGGTPLTRKADYYADGDIPWLKTKEVNFSLIYETENHITQIGLNNSSAKLIPVNSVIIAMYGQGGTAGRVAINKIPLATNQACCNFVIDNNIADFRYIYYYIKQSYLQLVNLKTGSAQPNLNTRILKDFEIQLPPLAEQTQIANILSAIDDKIENNLAINKTLENMAMALYKHWFVDFGPFQDGEFIESELGQIPKGWEVKKFNHLIDKIIDNRGKTPPLSKEKTKFLLLETYQLSRTSLFPNEIKNNKAKYVSEEIYNNLKWFRKGHPEFMDILFATVGNGIPNWSIMYENNGVGIAQNVVAIRPKSNISSSFLRYSFESTSFLEQFDGYVITTAQPSIKLSDLNMIDMLLPDKNVISDWNEIVHVYVSQVYSNYKENQSLTKLRDTLLPKLISGEVRLKEFRAQVETIL